MKYAYKNVVQGTIILTDEFHTDLELQTNNSLYKFIWVTEEMVKTIVSHIDLNLKKEEILSLNPSHNLEIKEIKGKYITLLQFPILRNLQT